MVASNLITYCITQKKLSYLNNLGLNVIVSGKLSEKDRIPLNWYKDSTKINISKKNKNFGTLTSLYWIWKNHSKKIKKDQWVGLCHYRRFWIKDKHDKKINTKNLKSNILNKIEGKNKKYNAFVLSPQNLTGYKLSKIFKKAKRDLILNPRILTNKKFQTINLHFNMFHIYGALTESSFFMKEKDQQHFLNYINKETSYYPFSLFILKKDKFVKMCEETFEWIFKCEKLFKLKNLKGYGQIRIFDFLAERFFSYWITKYTRYKILPGVILDSQNKKESIFI